MDEIIDKFLISLSFDCGKVEAKNGQKNQSEACLPLTCTLSDFQHIINRETDLGLLEKPDLDPKTKAGEEHFKIFPDFEDENIKKKNIVNTDVLRQVPKTGNDSRGTTKVEITNGVACTICEKIFKSRGILGTHMQLHNDISYSCEICERSFKQKSGLFQHMTTHGSKTYSCEICAKKFANAANLSRHRKTHVNHGCISETSFQKKSIKKRDKPKHVCSICEKVLSGKALLIEHMNIHKNLRPHVCDQCPASFAGRANLFRHKKMHKKKEISK